MSDLFEFPQVKDLPDASKILDTSRLTKMVKEAVAKKEVADAIEAAATEAIKSIKAPPWRAVARLSTDFDWETGSIIAKRSAGYTVRFDRDGRIKTLKASDVVPYIFRYAPGEVLSTVPVIRELPSPDDHRYSLLVHSFPSNGGRLSAGFARKILALLVNKLTVIDHNSKVYFSVYGFTDNVGGARLNANLRLQRYQSARNATMVAGASFAAAVRQRTPFSRLQFVQNQQVVPETSALAVSNPQDPVKRGDIKDRPLLRSALISFAATGNSLFLGKSSGPNRKKLTGILRTRLDEISVLDGSLKLRRRAYIAERLMRLKPGDLKERYFTVQMISSYEASYNKGLSVHRWLYHGSGQSAWELLFSQCRQDSSLGKVNALLDGMYQDMNKSYRRVYQINDAYHGRTHAAPLLRWIRSNSRSGGLFKVLFIR